MPAGAERALYDRTEYLRVIGLPDGILDGVDPGDFHVIIGRLDGESACAAMADDHGGDYASPLLPMQFIGPSRTPDR